MNRILLIFIDFTINVTRLMYAMTNHIYLNRIHYGTWESAVHGLANMKDLGEIRKKLFKEPLPYSKPRQIKRPGNNGQFKQKQKTANYPAS